MSLSDITNKIKSDALERASVVLQEAKNREEQISVEVEEKKKALEAKYKDLIAETVSKNEERVQSSAKRAGKQHMEEIKREAVNGVFAKAYEKLVSLKESEYEAMLEKLASGLEFGDSKLTVYAPENRKAETEKVLKGANIKAEIETDKSIDGGFRMEGEDFEFDLTFKKLIEKKRDNLEIAVAELLFS